jgi:hypothetical protein
MLHSDSVCLHPLHIGIYEPTFQLVNSEHSFLYAVNSLVPINNFSNTTAAMLHIHTFRKLINRYRPHKATLIASHFQTTHAITPYSHIPHIPTSPDTARNILQSPTAISHPSTSNRHDKIHSSSHLYSYANRHMATASAESTIGKKAYY